MLTIYIISCVFLIVNAFIQLVLKMFELDKELQDVGDEKAITINPDKIAVLDSRINAIESEFLRIKHLLQETEI